MKVLKIEHRDCAVRHVYDCGTSIVTRKTCFAARTQVQSD
jgi:hypothetical protein